MRAGARQAPVCAGQAGPPLLNAGPCRAKPRGGCDGRIAQLVEQLTLNQRVQGSSPCAPTIDIKDLAVSTVLEMPIQTVFQTVIFDAIAHADVKTASPAASLGMEIPSGGGPLRVEIQCASLGDAESMTRAARRPSRAPFTKELPMSRAPQDSSVPRDRSIWSARAARHRSGQRPKGPRQVRSRSPPERRRRR
jgi:hypothetical protein